MLSPIRFQDPGHQNFWKQYIYIFDFLHGGIHQENVVCEATNFGWVYPVMTIHSNLLSYALTQTCQDSSGVILGSVRGICR